MYRSIDAKFRIDPKIRELSAPHNVWIDHHGQQWKVPEIKKRLKFMIPCHAALRAYVFWRDQYRCQVCGVIAENIPTDYHGRHAIDVNPGWCILLDHIVSRAQGGTNHPNNLRTLCQSCNSRKACLLEGAGGHAHVSID